MAMKARMKGGARNTVMSLQVQAKMWTTPQAHDISPRGSGQKPTAAAGNACLARDAMNWPTPSAMQDTKGDADTGAIERRISLGKQLALAHIARSFSHPAPQTSTAGLPPSQWRPTSRRLLRSATSHVALVSLRRWLRRGNWRKRRLNPSFVEWLMGWPSGHALCACSATAYALWRRDMRGALSALPTASGAWIWEPAPERAEPEQMEMSLDL